MRVIVVCVASLVVISVVWTLWALQPRAHATASVRTGRYVSVRLPGPRIGATWLEWPLLIGHAQAPVLIPSPKDVRLVFARALPTR